MSTCGLALANSRIRLHVDLRARIYPEDGAIDGSAQTVVDARSGAAGDDCLREQCSHRGYRFLRR